jgi:hypothetical protein
MLNVRVTNFPPSCIQFYKSVKYWLELIKFIWKQRKESSVWSTNCVVKNCTPAYQKCVPHISVLCQYHEIRGTHTSKGAFFSVIALILRKKREWKLQGRSLMPSHKMESLLSSFLYICLSTRHRKNMRWCTQCAQHLMLL